MYATFHCALLSSPIVCCRGGSAQCPIAREAFVGHASCRERRRVGEQEEDSPHQMLAYHVHE
eukprot:1297919-Prymnesium_polylepis.1